MQERTEWARVLEGQQQAAATTAGSPAAAPDAGVPSLAPCGPAHALEPAGALRLAVEVGSHCVRALLHDGAQELARPVYDTLLGKGLAAGGSLQQAAVQATLSSLRAIRKDAAAVAEAQGCQGVTVTRAVATEAVRQAGDDGRLLELAAAELASPVQVLTGEEEGALAFAGASAAIAAAMAPRPSSPASPPPLASAAAGVSSAPLLLLVDLGGKSTEFAIGRLFGGVPEAIISIQLGCVGLRELADAAASEAAKSIDSVQAQADPWVTCARHAEQLVLHQVAPRLQPWLQPHSDSCSSSAPPITPNSIHDPPAGPTAIGGRTSAANKPYSRLLPLPQQQPHQQQPCGSDVGAAASGASGSQLLLALTGGTATTLAALQLRLPSYQGDIVQGSTLTIDDLEGMAQQYGSPQGVAHALEVHGWLTQARAASLSAGAAGLAGVMRGLGTRSALVSDADLLDGLMAEMLQGRGQGPERADLEMGRMAG